MPRTCAILRFVQDVESSRAECLGEAFAQLMRVHLNEAIVNSLTASQVTFPQFETLKFIDRHPMSTVGDLSEGLQISYPSATNMVIRLHKKGLLMKRGTRADRRIVRLGLTNTGKELVNAVTAERTEMLTKVLKKMSPTERAGLINGLERFLQSAVEVGVLQPEAARDSSHGLAEHGQMS